MMQQTEQLIYVREITVNIKSMNAVMQITDTILTTILS